MIKITVNTNSGRLTKEYEEKVLFSKVLYDLGLHHDMPCNGKGICGKCKIKIEGKASALTMAERDNLSALELDDNIRLSCQAYAEGDVSIDYTDSEAKLQGLIQGFMPDFIKNPITASEKCKAVAVDIGTTTIAMYLYSFPEGVCIKTASEKNLQTKFGADVISRIEYSMNRGTKELQKTINDQINRMISEITDEAPDTVVITGNTVMLHFFTGLETEGIAKAPFTPESLFGEWNGRIYFPRCISSYVGADITTAIIASNMQKDKTSFLVDIGTNGEMALWHNEKLICCSTAAGPAFEGAGITHGMLATTGAISKVYIKDNTIQYETIDNAPAKGICGTGVIDVISCLRTLNIIDETGYMEDDYELGSSGVYITTGDVRAVQLAKSAIMAGIETLLHECNTSYEQIERFYIAGGFGAFIDKNSSANIGLIPKEILDRVVVLGNAAGTGACIILQSKEMLAKSEETAKTAKVIELSDSPVFMEKYMNNMMF